MEVANVEIAICLCCPSTWEPHCEGRFVQSRSKREADNIAAQCISERLAVAARVFSKTTPHLDIDAFGRDRQQEFVVVMKPNGDTADWLAREQKTG